MVVEDKPIHPCKGSPHKAMAKQLRFFLTKNLPLVGFKPTTLCSLEPAESFGRGLPLLDVEDSIR